MGKHLQGAVLLGRQRGRDAFLRQAAKGDRDAAADLVTGVLNLIQAWLFIIMVAGTGGAGLPLGCNAAGAMERSFLRRHSDHRGSVRRQLTRKPPQRVLNGT
ncbi:hypothetical protein SKAU_G00266600 [Synaphobranchus kaupii]|uniref:Uncharacterized protein n=1 Tax=Synaphobranchus kaupii TaxID=118154 RepID=A0A9Q1EZR9_SYNKA|nr:hypothetical protein SKAU_G00266600 [Synaphobranchus kaupii]